MKVNEIKKTKIIEEVVRTEYVAEDGTVFRSEDECKVYEESALFAISKELKRLSHKKNGASEYDIYDECSDECLVEIFNAETERDLENIRRYIYLKVASQFGKVNEHDVELPNITAGHEVIVHWDYDEDGVWTIGDGSINAFCDYIRGNLMRLITPKEENANA